MFIDARRLPAGTLIESEFCVIGAGAAGLPLAEALERAGRSVCVVESGGLEPDALAASLNAGSNLGLPYHDLQSSRDRQFGGTMATWSGRCVPLDPIDFEHRPWVPHSGWPIRFADLEPWWRRANEVFGVGEFRYDESLWRDLGFADGIGFDPTMFTTRFWRIRALRFGRTYRRHFQNAEGIRVLLHATASELVPSGDSNRIERVRLQSFGGNSVEVRAKHFVLATGGIENARLLLASDQLERNGIGNAHDLVGRFFMEHPKCRCARIAARDRYGLLETWRKHFPRRQPPLWPTITTTPELQRRHEILNSSLAIYYRTLPAVTEAALIWSDARKRGRLPDRWVRVLLTGWPIYGEIPANFVRRYIRRRAVIARPEHIYLLVRGEQAPNPDSRVCLSRARDRLGQRHADVDWRLSPIDHRSVAVLTSLFAKEFERLGLGTVEPDAWLGDGAQQWPIDPGAGDHHELLQGGNHHIGTTRMADDPRRGVVDADCRVHGKANLWIAGSSVFPTAGWANPTLTIVALALRLADHLATAA